MFLEISQNSQDNTCARLSTATLLKKTLWHTRFPVSFTKFLSIPLFTEHRRWLLPPIPRFLYALITEQVHNQMFFRVGQSFQIFRAQIVLLIMLKPRTSQGNIRKLRFPDCLKLFSRRKTSTKAGNILFFLGNSVVLRTLSNI